jgi:hypothetical protein
MGLMDQPAAYYGGGRVIKGDIELDGDLVQEPIRIGLNAETLPDTLAIGKEAVATGRKSMAIGKDTISNNQNTISFGEEAEATGGDATALGTETTAPSRWNTVIGYAAGADEETVGLEPNGDNVVLVGRKAQASGDNGVAIGEISRANGDNSTAVGRDTQAFGKDSSVFGQGSVVSAQNATAVGQGVSLSDDDATLVGTDVEVSGEKATGIGSGATSSSNSSTAIGFGATASGAEASSIGKSSEASGEGSVAFGVGATVTADNSVALGKGVTVTQPDTFSFGDRNINVPPNKSILYPNDSGEATLVDFGVTRASSDGATQSYSFEIDSEPLLIIAADANGDGGIKNKRVKLPGDVKESGQLIWDSENEYITLEALEENQITVNGGDGIEGGTTGKLGGSITFDVKPSDLTGDFLSVDSQDNIGVDISTGLQDDGSGAIQFNEDLGYDFSKRIDFQTSISVGEFQDLKPTTVEPAAPGSSIARLYVDGDVSPPKVKIKDNSGESTTLMTLTQ